MKTIIVSALFALGALAPALSASAQGAAGPGMMGARSAPYGASATSAPQGSETASIGAALADIYRSQGVASGQRVDCAKVTGNQFETLGDAYMEAVHPGAAHEYMDRMMGGEGSASLQAMHIAMGRAYLGCGGSYPYAYASGGSQGENGGYWGMPMMGGYAGGYGGPMMVGWGFGSDWLGTLALLAWLAAGILLCLLLARKLNAPARHE